MFQNLVVRIAVSASVIYCGMYNHPGYLWLPVLLMVIFVVRGTRVARDDAERVEALAEQVYFLAFSATLSALLGLLGRVYIAGDSPNDSRATEIMGAVALFNTLFGVLGMVTLKDYAQQLADQGSPVRPAGPTASTVSSSATGAAGPPAVGYEDVEQLNRRVVVMIEQVSQGLEKLPTAVDSLTSAVRKGSGAAQEFENDVQQMHSVLDEWERLQERGIEEDDPHEN